MPTLVLKDHQQVTITTQQENVIVDFLNSDDIALKILGYVLTKYAILYIKPGGQTAADLPPSNAPRLKSDNRSDEEQSKSAESIKASIREAMRTRRYDKLKKVKGDQKNER